MSTRSRLDILLVPARTHRYRVAGLLGTAYCAPAFESAGGKRQPGAVLSPHFTDPAGRHGPYADLHVRTAPDVDSGRSYALDLPSRPNAVDLPQAPTMAVFSRRTDRRMAAPARQFGAPTDFAEYLTCFSVALGSTVFAEHPAELRPEGTHWTRLVVGQMRAWLRHREHSPTAPADRL